MLFLLLWFFVRVRFRVVAFVVVGLVVAVSVLDGGRFVLFFLTDLCRRAYLPYFVSYLLFDFFFVADFFSPGGGVLFKNKTDPGRGCFFKIKMTALFAKKQKKKISKFQAGHDVLQK